MKKRRNSKDRTIRHAIATGLWAFLLAAVAGILSQTAVEEITVVGLTLLLLFVVILVGIVFDVIGVAATAARETDLHARAANKVFGSVQAVRLVKNAPRVASFCNDMVGDVCGTLSGAIGVTIVLKILISQPEQLSVWATTMMTALIAALVVGGKALGKAFAIKRGTIIMFRVGQCLAWLENVSLFKPLRSEKKPGAAKSRSQRGKCKRPTSREKHGMKRSSVECQGKRDSERIGSRWKRLKVSRCGQVKNPPP